MDALERYLKKINLKRYYTFPIAQTLATWRYSFSVKIESDFEKAQHWKFFSLLRTERTGLAGFVNLKTILLIKL